MRTCLQPKYFDSPSETTQVTLKMKKTLVDALRKAARERSEAEGMDYYYTHLIREACEIRYGKEGN